MLLLFGFNFYLNSASFQNSFDSLYTNLMNYDKGSKSCLLEEEFSEFYSDLAKKDEDMVWDHIKKMGYGKD